MCQTILEENVYWLSYEHRKDKDIKVVLAPTRCVLSHI